MAHNIADLTLDEIVARLIAGEALIIPGGNEFSLPLTESRAILAYYNRDRRAYWNPDRDTAILDGEIDRVLDALDKVPAATTIIPRQASTPHKWKLIKVIAHRFRGLHRHCAEDGSDPKLFELDLAADVTLIRGFNGAGKTSIISAICWCLTGMGLQSQGLPAPLHDLVSVQGVGSEASGESSVYFQLPAIVPVPTEDELVAVDGTPKADSWVRLTFRSLSDGSEIEVERQLQADGRRGFKAVPVGLEKLGLSDLALQVGTIMPGIAAATRFDDKTTLSQAVSTLTGLRPLAHFGRRSARLHNRLTDKYPKQAREEKQQLEATAAQQLETLRDLTKGGVDLPNLDCLVPPNDAEPDAWMQGIDTAEARLRAAENQAASDAILVLGSLPALGSDIELGRFADDLKAAEQCFSTPALKGLPSLRFAARLGELQEDDMANAEHLLRALEAEARTLVSRMVDIERADRLRLYGLVAKWHDAAHSGEPFTACPVCARDLMRPGAIPWDVLLGQSVAEALEDARKADAAVLKTAAEWERDTMRSLRGNLPAVLAAFLDDDVPDDLAIVYKNAFSREVFSQPEFPASLKAKMSASVAALCADSWKDAPPRPPLPAVTLPDSIPDNEKLRDAIRKVRRVIHLARYRREHAGFARSAVASVLKAGGPETQIPADHRSIAGQLNVLNGYRETAVVFAGIRRQIVQIRQTCEKWENIRSRLGKLDRAAKAVEPFMAFPDLVHDQVAGLIASLDVQSSAWAGRMYRARYPRAPAYAGLDRQKGDGFTFLAAQGKHLVEAHRVMNASALRAYLFAFVLALWQQVWARSGGLSTILMDDPQDLLDPGNIANLAATIPHMIAAGMNPLIVSNDFGLFPAIEAIASKGVSPGASYRTRVLELSPISTGECTASLSPA